MHDLSDFVIRDGILLEYRGPGGTVVVPEGVIGIRTTVFRKSPVVEVLLPEGLQWMDTAVFASCFRLRRLVLPGSLTVLPPAMCKFCGALEEVHIPEGVRILSWDAFHGSGLKTLKLPDSVRMIQEGCFQKCRNLEEIVLGKGLQMLGAATFQDCASLRAVSFPDSLTQIGRNAFENCVLLASVRMGQSLETVESSAFQGCRNLREVEFPETLSSLSNTAFVDCTSLKRVTLPGPQVLLQASGLPPDRPLARTIRAPRLLPEELPETSRPAALAGFRELQAEGMDLRPEIVEAWEAFSSKGSDSLKNLENLDSLKNPEQPEEPFTIVDGALVSTTLRSGRVVVPEGVTGILAGVFRESDVEEVWLPDTVQWLQPEAFQHCRNLRAVRLPAGLTVLPESVFLGCGSLRSIRIPDTVKRIGAWAFFMAGLQTLTLPASLESTGMDAFSACQQLKEVRFPEGLRFIDSCGFMKCSGLVSVDLPDSLEVLDSSAFWECTSLERVRLGRGLTRLEAQTFGDCRALKEVSSSAPFLTVYEDCFEEIPRPFQLTMEGFFLNVGEPGIPRIVAPRMDPALLHPDCLHSALLGFAAAGGQGFRFEQEYLRLLQEHRRELWNSPNVLRLLLRLNLLNREDVDDCLRSLQENDEPELIAEVLEYVHRRFPDQSPLPLELP